MLLKSIAEISGVALGLATLPGAIETALLTLGAILPPARHIDSSNANQNNRFNKLAVVIPAHNESLTILRCILSLKTCDPIGKDREASIVVVADNCIDQTAELAIGAGVTTIVRSDTERQGKGFALQDAFKKLLSDPFDAFVVVDADTVVEANFLFEIARLLDKGADAVQARYLPLNPNTSLGTRLTSVALMAFNVLRPRSRDRLGFSAGILGNGFALARETLVAVPFTASSIVEDLEYHLRLVSSGKRVVFADRTTVRAEMPIGKAAMSRQRSRWEGGRLRMAAENVTPLARDLFTGSFRMLEPLLELLTLPLSFQLLILTLILMVGSAASQIYALVAFALLATHVIAAVVVAGGAVNDFAVLLSAPFYLAWKLTLSIEIFRFSRRDAKWLRTQR